MENYQNSPSLTKKYSEQDMQYLQQKLQQKCEEYNSYEHKITGVTEHHYGHRSEYIYHIENEADFVYSVDWGKTYIANPKDPNTVMEERYFVKYDGQKDNDEQFKDDLRVAEGNAKIGDTSHFLTIPSYQNRNEEHTMWGGMYQLRTLVVQDFVERVRNQARNRRESDPRFKENKHLLHREVPESMLKVGYSLTGVSAFQKLTEDSNMLEEVDSISAAFWQMYDEYIEMIICQDAIKGKWGNDYDFAPHKQAAKADFVNEIMQLPSNQHLNRNLVEYIFREMEETDLDQIKKHVWEHWEDFFGGDYSQREATYHQYFENLNVCRKLITQKYSQKLRSVIATFKDLSEIDVLFERGKKVRDKIVKDMRETRGRILITMGSEESCPEHLEKAFQTISEGKNSPLRVNAESIRNAIRQNASLDGVLINDGDPKHMFIYTMGDKHEEPYWRRLRNRMLHHRLQIIRNLFLPFYDTSLMSESDWRSMRAVA